MEMLLYKNELKFHFLKLYFDFRNVYLRLRSTGVYHSHCNIISHLVDSKLKSLLKK